MTLFKRFRKHTRHQSPPRRRGERGMTLIEIMVVVTILGLIAAAVGVSVIPILNASKIDTTRTMLTTIDGGLKLYYTRHGKYPDTGQGLAVLVNEKILDKTPRDGFGNDFVYLSESGKPTVISYGKDGAPGGEGEDADLNSNSLDARGK